MLHPLISTIIKRPDLVVDHVSAYAELVQMEVGDVVEDLLTRAAAWAAAVIAGVLFLGLAGVALMLGLLQNQFHWSLVVVPAVALLLLAVAVARAVKPWRAERFPELRAQLASDVEALRAVA
jgi:membrane protein implicated in regulation of membrane protease activity